MNRDVGLIEILTIMAIAMIAIVFFAAKKISDIYHNKEQR